MSKVKAKKKPLFTVFSDIADLEYVCNLLAEHVISFEVFNGVQNDEITPGLGIFETLIDRIETQRKCHEIEVDSLLFTKNGSFQDTYLPEIYSDALSLLYND